MGAVLSWATNAALFTLACYLAADTGNEVIAAVLAPAPEQVVEAPPTSPIQDRNWADRQVILTRNLFNSTTIDPPPAPEELAEEIEKSKLPLTLLGTFAATNPDLARAAIEDRQQRKTQVVGLGDSLQGKATVLRIERRRVVLLENGVQRELVFEEQNTPKLRKPTRVARNTRRRLPARSRVQKLDENRFAVSREELEETLRDPSELLSQARILPKYEDGEMLGVQVNAIKSNSLFEQIGLQNGDVITEVNGLKINAPEQSAALLQEFSDSTSFSVQLQRADGTTQTLEFESD